ncbi:MAG: CARDB domain-containing protein [Candidatus Micrarchaeota archaeon]
MIAHIGFGRRGAWPALALYFTLALLFAASLPWAAQSVQNPFPLSIPHPAPAYYMGATLNLKTTATLSATSGPVLLPKPANAADLPAEIWVCPNTALSLQSQDQSDWNPGATKAEYPLPPPPDLNHRLCPRVLYNLGGTCFDPNPWPSASAAAPVSWKDQTSANQIYSPYIYVLAQGPGNAVYPLASANANTNVDYVIDNLGTTYLNQKAEGGIDAYGKASASLDNNLISSQSLDSGLAKTWAVTPATVGTHTLSVQTQANTLTGVVHLLPDMSDTTKNIKDLYHQTTPASFASTPINYVIHVVDTTNCQGAIEGITPNPITVEPGGQTEVSITVHNTRTDMPVTPTGASASNGWQAAPAGGNDGFNQPILPDQNVILHVRLTAPNPPTGPVVITIKFDDPCGPRECDADVNVDVTPPAASAQCSADNWAPGMVCRDDCNTKVGPTFACNASDCTCYDTAPKNARCSEGNGAAGIACQDDCAAAFGPQFACEAATCTCYDTRLPAANCSAGTGAPGMYCSNDCFRLGPTWKCNTNACTCYDTGTFSCTITTNSQSTPKNLLKQGENLLMSAYCTNNSRIIACPTLSWIHDFQLADIQAASASAGRCPGMSNLLVTDPGFSPRQARLFTFGADSACATPVPQSGDVAVRGRINDQLIKCSVSGSNNGRNISIMPNCSVFCQLDYNNSLDAGPLYAHDIPIKATCQDTVSGSDYCPRLGWSSDAGDMLPASTAPGSSPRYSTLRATNMAGTQVQATYTDLFGNTCGCSLPLNRSEPNLKCRIDTPGAAPKLGDTINVQVHTYNDGRGDANVSTYTEFNVSGSRYPATNNPVLVPRVMRSGNEQIDTYTYTCANAGLAQVSAQADYTKQQPEGNEQDNVCWGSINCGGVLVCSDYI